MTAAMTEQQFATALDAMDNHQLHDALLAIVAYEQGTDEWICEYQGEYEEEHGQEFEEDDAYWAAYEAFSDELAPDVLEQFGVTKDHFGLLMETLCDDWEKITALMVNADSRNVIRSYFALL